MPSKFTNTRAAERPTLPSIHTLDLPMLAPSNVKYAPHDNVHGFPSIIHDRKVSTSSSATSASRSASPSPSCDTRGRSVFGASSATPTKFRLVPCPMDAADAFIFVPPPGTYVPTPTNYAARNGNGQGILLMGKALQHLRRSPPRPLAKGARLHPYRIVRGETPARGENAAPPSRRASVVSITSFSASS
ncbi:hypothetical protein HYPSUDRAFT_37695 [Hypholoma sublateritium FD-334 SS-4]|uniref:Uncharacterized protein n=1 Tax=Hypholoma sublateritium (strain FD-334 SS-4) TaxID=945553 RepID=A0A0D2LE05_HYPSF|nr:hypothetical protein HYPSUDRAFT_37695 [Hypholoma sublateritium FD-334 SS-4]